MGQAHVIFVRDDGLQKCPTAELPGQVGAAVVRMCTSPEVYFTPDRDADGKVVAIGGMTNCIEHVDYVHSADVRGYLWAGNCLRPLHEISDADLELFLDLIASEFRRRREARSDAPRPR